MLLSCNLHVFIYFTYVIYIYFSFIFNIFFIHIFIFLYGIYVILNGHLSPGGGFSGGSIIGAGSLVLPGEYPENALLVGVPAKVVKYRFDEEKIQILNEIQWWNWDDDKIRANSALFYNNDLTPKKAQHLKNLE